MLTRGIAICTYNRGSQIGQVIQAVLRTKPTDARLIVCDDGSNDETSYILSQFPDVNYIRGRNLGVGANKNRALHTLQDCDFICILEDDLIPFESGWFELYENAYLTTGIHHFCRVQDKEVPEVVADFTTWAQSKGIDPLYGPAPRGDLTFITKKVVRKVGGLNAQFVGVGYAHGEWSNRVVKANLIPHPLKWVDFRQARDKFEQLGDTSGGRWLRPRQEVKEEMKRNGAIAKRLRQTNYVFHPLVFP